MERLQAFRYELRPNGEQQRTMRRFAGSCRFVFNKALALQQAALGPVHPEVASTMNNIAIVLRSQGKADDALALYRSVLSIQEAALGADHPDVATSLNNMAVLVADGVVCYLCDAVVVVWVICGGVVAG